MLSVRAMVAALPCDLLLAPHPGASGWDYANGPRPTSVDYSDLRKLLKKRSKSKLRPSKRIDSFS